MKKDSLSKRTFSLDFKHQVLIDYHRSGSTKYFIEKKYGLHCRHDAQMGKSLCLV